VCDNPLRLTRRGRRFHSLTCLTALGLENQGQKKDTWPKAGVRPPTSRQGDLEGRGAGEHLGKLCVVGPPPKSFTLEERILRRQRGGHGLPKKRRLQGDIGCVARSGRHRLGLALFARPGRNPQPKKRPQPPGGAFAKTTVGGREGKNKKGRPLEFRPKLRRSRFSIFSYPRAGSNWQKAKAKGKTGRQKKTKKRKRFPKWAFASHPEHLNKTPSCRINRGTSAGGSGFLHWAVGLVCQARFQGRSQGQKKKKKTLSLRRGTAGQEAAGTPQPSIQGGMRQDRSGWVRGPGFRGRETAESVGPGKVGRSGDPPLIRDCHPCRTTGLRRYSQAGGPGSLSRLRFHLGPRASTKALGRSILPLPFPPWHPSIQIGIESKH